MLTRPLPGTSDARRRSGGSAQAFKLRVGRANTSVISSQSELSSSSAVGLSVSGEPHCRLLSNLPQSCRFAQRRAAGRTSRALLFRGLLRSSNSATNHAELGQLFGSYGVDSCAAFNRERAAGGPSLSRAPATLFSVQREQTSSVFNGCASSSGARGGSLLGGHSVDSELALPDQGSIFSGCPSHGRPCILFELVVSPATSLETAGIGHHEERQRQFVVSRVHVSQQPVSKVVFPRCQQYKIIRVVAAVKTTRDYVVKFVGAWLSFGSIGGDRISDQLVVDFLVVHNNCI